MKVRNLRCTTQGHEARKQLARAQLPDAPRTGWGFPEPAFPLVPRPLRLPFPAWCLLLPQVSPCRFRPYLLSFWCEHSEHYDSHMTVSFALLGCPVTQNPGFIPSYSCFLSPCRTSSRFSIDFQLRNEYKWGTLPISLAGQKDVFDENSHLSISVRDWV